jgi:membrane protein implicated in regulation of membrane protease activity
MADRGRYDSAMFWLAFGTAAAVIGLALMTIGVSRSAPGAGLLNSLWFDGGLGILVFGALLLAWALLLYLARRRGEAQQQASAGSNPKESRDVEAIRGYFSERERLFKLWERQQKNRRSKR